MRPSCLKLHRHTVASIPAYHKMSRIPGKWHPREGPPGDTLARRIYFYHRVLMARIGNLTAVVKTPRSRYLFRKMQARLFKFTSLTLALFCVFTFGCLWMIVAYNAFAAGPPTAILQKKTREHRVSKQIMTMVREREADLAQKQHETEARQIIEQRTNL